MAEWQENYQLYKRYIKNLSLVYQKRKDIRSYIELMLSLVVIAIFGIFAIRPTLVTIAELNQEIENKEKTITDLSTKIENLNVAQNLANTNSAGIALVDTAVPNAPLPTIYIRQIEGLAKSHTVDLFNLSVNEVELLGVQSAAPIVSPDGSIPPSSYLEYSFDISGSYENLKSFIFEVERLRRPTYIDSMTLRKDENEEGFQIILSVIGRAPYLPGE